MVTASSNSRYTQLKYFLTCSINPHGVPNTDLLRTHLGNLPSWAKRLLRMAGNGAENWTRSDVPARLPATALLSPRSARPYGNKCDRRPNGCQLELGLKEQVRGRRRNPQGPLKTYSVQCDTGKAEAFSHHPRIERSCPNSRQRLPYAGPRRASDAAAADAPMTCVPR